MVQSRAKQREAINSYLFLVLFLRSASRGTVLHAHTHTRTHTQTHARAHQNASYVANNSRYVSAGKRNKNNTAFPTVRRAVACVLCAERRPRRPPCVAP
uniref:Putative secreted protein n=1 Tax=Amblyomma cajennense TaxID=34607 RepID=A0A023FBL0_AMBCJ